MTTEPSTHVFDLLRIVPVIFLMLTCSLGFRQHLRHLRTVRVDTAKRLEMLHRVLTYLHGSLNPADEQTVAGVGGVWGGVRPCPTALGAL